MLTIVADRSSQTARDQTDTNEHDFNTPYYFKFLFQIQPFLVPLMLTPQWKPD